MTAYTLFKNTNIRELTVAGGYSARTGGDTIANTNGFSLTIDQDTRFGLGAPASDVGSLGNILQTAAFGGDIIFDGRYCRLVPFTSGSGTITPGATITCGGATGVVVGLYSSLTSAPVLTGVATGWIKIAAWNGVAFPASTAYTQAGYTFTTAASNTSIVGTVEIAGDDSATFTGNRLGKFQVLGAYYDLGVTTGNRASSYQVPNNGKLLFLPSIEVQGATWTITGVTWANGVATYTTSATHDMLVGQPATVTGVTPSGYNVEDQFITDLTDNTFKITIVANPGSYTSGGSVAAFEQYPCAGTLPCTAAAVFPDEDTRRGKLFWNTDGSNVLTAPIGCVRLGSDGTNSTGGFCPPAGRKIRIPNMLFQCCTTAARGQNVLPNATLGTRYDFTMTGAGQMEIDKASMCWYLSNTQGYSCNISNSGFMSATLVTEVPSFISWTNVCVGQEAAVVPVQPVTFSLNTGGALLRNVVGAQAGTTGVGGAWTWLLNICPNYTLVDCVGWILAFRTGSNVKNNNFTGCLDLTAIRFHHIGASSIVVNCTNHLILDTKYTDTTGARQTTFPNIVFNPSGPACSGIISGLKFVGYRGQMFNSIYSCSSQAHDCSFRNIGTPSAPLETGDGPYYDLAWSRATTVCTVAQTAHGLIVGENINVYWVSSLSAIAIGVKTVASVPTADTFTFACTNAGDASGTLTYYYCNASNVVPNNGNAAADSIRVQRAYVKFLRGQYSAADNSNTKHFIENSYPTFDPTWGANYANNATNGSNKLGPMPSNSPSASVYGSTWSDGVYGCTPDTTSYTWTRSTTTLTAQTTAGYPNLATSITSLVEVTASSDEVALNLGVYPLVAPNTLGTTANRFRLTVHNAGGTSGTAEIHNETGRISVLLNEGTPENTHYEVTAGNPRFNGSGYLRMFDVGDQIVFTTPYWIRGHVGFMKAVPTINAGVLQNFWFEYQIDTGAGFSGVWKTAYRRTNVASADGSAGGYTVTQVDASDNWIVDGDRIQTAGLGNSNRDARVASGGGTTTLTFDKPHNLTFTNQHLDVFNLPNETSNIDATGQGFRLKLRITTLVANASSIGNLAFKTLQTATSRAFQLPLDTVTVTLTANVDLTGAEIRVYDLDNSPAGSLGSEIAGIESSGSTFSFLTTTSNAVWIQVMKTGYREFSYSYVTTEDDVTLPLILQAETNT